MLVEPTFKVFHCQFLGGDVKLNCDEILYYRLFVLFAAGIVVIVAVVVAVAVGVAAVGGFGAV